MALLAAGDHAKGISCLRSALQLAPHNPVHDRNLARALTDTGGRAEAIGLLRKAAAMHPEEASLLLDLAGNLRSEGSTGEAIPWLLCALRLDSANFEALMPLAECLLEQQAPAEALTKLQSLSPETDPALLLHAHARALMARGGYQDAVPYYEQILALRPNDPLTLVALGCIAFVMRDIDTTFRRHTEAYQSRPRIHPALFFYVFDLCILGRFGEARRVVHQWKQQGNIYLARATDYGKPFCDPLTDLRGASVLLHSDWGFGDALSMVRFAPALAARGATVIVEARKPICSLLRTVPGIAEAIAKYEPCPEFQFECVLDELWLFDDFTLQTAGCGVPYVFPEHRRISHWHTRIPEGPHLNVGLCWEGSKLFLDDKYLCRSLPFAALHHLLNCPGIRYYSLANDSIAKCPAAAHYPNLFDIGPALTDFMEIAAAIQCLDLVVTIDTSFAHLCGALGKKAMVVMPYAPYTWRWFLGRADSPFYPSLQLFWPGIPGEWSDALTKVREELCAAAASKATLYHRRFHAQTHS